MNIIKLHNHSQLHKCLSQKLQTEYLNNAVHCADTRFKKFGSSVSIVIFSSRKLKNNYESHSSTHGENIRSYIHTIIICMQ